MTLSDYTKQPRGPYGFDFWTANQAIPSTMGDFKVELLLFDGNPPDNEIIRLADELVTIFRASVETIHDKIFEHYKAASEYADWLESCGVPADLDRNGISAHLKTRTLTVSRDNDEGPTYSSRVYVSPKWDEEHAIYLANFNGEWEFVDC